MGREQPCRQQRGIGKTSKLEWRDRGAIGSRAGSGVRDGVKNHICFICMIAPAYPALSSRPGDLTALHNSFPSVTPIRSAQSEHLHTRYPVPRLTHPPHCLSNPRNMQTHDCWRSHMYLVGCSAEIRRLRRHQDPERHQGPQHLDQNRPGPAPAGVGIVALVARGRQRLLLDHSALVDTFRVRVRVLPEGLAEAPPKQARAGFIITHV